MRFPPLSSWMRGWRVVDRGRGATPSYPSPVSRFESLRFGITYCPSCGEKVSVLCDGVCRDCQPEDAA